MATDQSIAIQPGGLLGKCEGCAAPLPLRTPKTGEQAFEWICNSCGRGYRAVLLENWPTDVRRNVSLAARPSQASSPPDAPDAWALEFDVEQPHPISLAFPDHLGAHCDLETDASRELDAEVGQAANLRVQPQDDPFASAVQQHGNRPYDQQTVSRFREMLCLASRQLNQQFVSLKAGDAAEPSATEAISRDGLHRIAEDKDLFVGLSLTAPSSGYPSQHSLRVAMLAMGVGTALGLDEDSLRNLGIGCLVHDVGMLSVDQALYDGRRILPAGDFAEIAKHPLWAVETLRRHAGLPLSVRMVAYQIHERCNGTGYPRGSTADQIHDLAKIAAVADAFMGLVSPRPHRPGVIPHHALKRILKDTQRECYDRAVVRALLNTVSLFPIGSFVKLSDGRVGRVIRASQEQYDRPIIEAWDRANLTAEPGLIDLRQHEGLSVAGCLPRLG